MLAERVAVTLADQEQQLLLRDARLVRVLMNVPRAWRLDWLAGRRSLDRRSDEVTVTATDGGLESPTLPKRGLNVLPRKRAPERCRNTHGKLRSLVIGNGGFGHVDPHVVRRVEIKLRVAVGAEDSAPTTGDLHRLLAAVTTRHAQKARQLRREPLMVHVVADQDRVGSTAGTATTQVTLPHARMGERAVA